MSLATNSKQPAANFVVGSQVWVEDPDLAWIDGEVVEVNGDEVTIKCTSGQTAPTTTDANGLRESEKSSENNTPTSHWHSITDSLSSLLSTLQQNFVPPVLIQKIFTQTFSHINVQLLNSLLSRPECLTFSNGEYMKAGLDELETWCAKAKEENAGSLWDELKHIRQAVGFLVIHQKSRISYDDIASDLCPMLSVQQHYRICTEYRDENYNTQGVSEEVTSSMKEVMTDDSNTDSFLLDDDTSIIPFTSEDITNSMQEKDFSDVKPPSELLGNPAFQFLQD